MIPGEAEEHFGDDEDEDDVRVAKSTMIGVGDGEERVQRK